MNQVSKQHHESQEEKQINPAPFSTENIKKDTENKRKDTENNAQPVPSFLHSFLMNPKLNSTFPLDNKNQNSPSKGW